MRGKSPATRDAKKTSKDTLDKEAIQAALTDHLT